MSRIEVCELVKQWGQAPAVDHVSFQVTDGSLTVLLGPSGCGKSTILRLIAGLETVTGGSIHIGDKEVTHMDPAQRGVSMVFQSYALFPHLTVRENILFGLRVRRVARAERRALLKDAASMVGLGDLLHRKPSQLSGGQRQRVALARAIVSRQPVCLMDEPLSNLDAKLRAEMREEIRALQQKLRLTMIYVTHDQIEAMTMADQVVLLKDGCIEQIGSPRALYRQPETVFAAQFMGSPPMNLLRLDNQLNPAHLAATGLWAPFLDKNAVSRIGVRPEHIQISQTGLPVQVIAADYLGAETVLRLDHHQQTVFARINGIHTFGPGDRLNVAWPPEAVHGFDNQGKRIDAGASG